MLTVTDLLARIDHDAGVPIDPLRPVPGECWAFRGWRNSAGYPYVSWDGRDQPAHRVIFAVTTGADLTGIELDHVCRNVACVNPAHEEPVTHAENMRRVSQAQRACRRAGHDWTNTANVRTRSNGRRYCAECDRIGQRQRHAQRRSA